MSWGGKGAWGKGGGGRMNIGDPTKVIWVGNVPEGTTYQDLLAFIKAFVPTAKWAEITKTTAAVGLPSAEEVPNALQTLKDVNFNGSILEVDKWARTGVQGGPGDSKGGGSKGKFTPSFGAAGPPTQVMKQQFHKPQLVPSKGGYGGKAAGGYGGFGGYDGYGGFGGFDGYGGKGWGGGKGKGKGKGGGRKDIGDPTKALWVGNVPVGTQYQELLELAKGVSPEAKWAEVFGGRGTAAIGFASEQAATQAISLLNGSLVGGSAIEVDFWSKPETTA